MRRLLFPLLFSTALLDCQSYEFRHITRVSVEVDTISTAIAASPGAAYIMIVQDTSGSMCEPINHDAGLATMGSGANDCAADQAADSKAGIVASSMQQVLDKLNPKVNIFNMGLFALPDRLDPDAGSCSAASEPIIAIDNAATTIPKIVSWYQGMVNIIGGGTPTAQTLLNAATDPALASTADPKARKYVLLITDGLPNCDDKNPCEFPNISGPAYLWTDGQGHGCESPSYQHLFAKIHAEPLDDAGQPFAEPPAECQCSQGSCPDPIGDAGGNIGAQCCVVDPELLTPGSPSLAFGAEQCLDSSGTIDAVQYLANDAGITTYVIGMGFDYTNPTILNEIAQAGDPRNSDAGYYQASDPTSLFNAINTIIQNAIPRCDFTLSGSVPANPALIQVKLDGTTLLLDDPNGFSYDADAGEIDLLGSACKTATDGNGNDLSVSLIAQP